MQKTFKYPNEEITIIWKPEICFHSGICARGLPGVFDPKRKPWVDMSQADTQQIIEQVKKCPSGALSYFMNNEQPADAIVSEQAAITQIEVSNNGPYLIKTECIIIHSDGREEIKKGTVALCRCGASNKKPYCDGTHRRIGFKG
jgi:uncharacterized Fe-S cluster protein YjdI